MNGFSISCWIFQFELLRGGYGSSRPTIKMTSGRFYSISLWYVAPARTHTHTHGKNALVLINFMFGLIFGIVAPHFMNAIGTYIQTAALYLSSPSVFKNIFLIRSGNSFTTAIFIILLLNRTSIVTTLNQ